MRLPVDGLAEPIILFVLFCRRQHPSARVRYSHDGLAEPVLASCLFDFSRMLAMVMLMLCRRKPPSFIG